MSTRADRRKILVTSTGALLMAATLLITVILPAEYGWDPLGSGAALGLLGMGEEGVAALHNQSGPWRSDRIEFELAPFEAVEYKYRLMAGATILFQWHANGEVLYDMHAQPDGTAPGYASSFEKARGLSSSGSYTAPFTGIHGWYWQNRGQQDITLTLETSGYYREAIEMRDGHEFRYEITGQGAAQP